MKEPEEPSGQEQVVCEICLKEIPLSAAKHEEAVDYVLHFCGVACYDIWKAQKSGVREGN